MLSCVILLKCVCSHISGWELTVEIYNVIFFRLRGIHKLHHTLRGAEGVDKV